jgi:hypothetical protein
MAIACGFLVTGNPIRGRRPEISPMAARFFGGLSIMRGRTPPEKVFTQRGSAGTPDRDASQSHVCTEQSQPRVKKDPGS